MGAIKSMILSTPVAFFVFNRPDLTEITFKAIAQAKPSTLLLVADGPRFSEEVEKCEQVKEIIKNVDWDCDVLTNFSEVNLGCKKRISSGLDWVFSTVEEAILIEDDCLPNQSFFTFCQILLERYRHDPRIMHISGSNFQNGQSRTSSSYYFSRYSHIWGWASWRRAWQYYDPDMKSWAEFKQQNLLSQLFEDPNELLYWQKVFERTASGDIDTWDFQWQYTCWTQNGLSILPNVNLTSNLGYDRPDATHTRRPNPYAKLPTVELETIQHPSFMVRNKVADAYTYHGLLGGRYRTFSAKVHQKLLQIRNNIKGSLATPGFRQ
jgi:hypothetical protein